MAKDKTAYVCSNCGQESPKWIGKCPSCGQWNTFKEIKVAGGGGSWGSSPSKAAQAGMALRKNRSLRLSEISSHDDPRIDMHDAEERYAEPGDYIKGDWRDGHLNYGEWYDAQGNKKAFIRLGDNPDTGSDQKLGKCAKR